MSWSFVCISCVIGGLLVGIYIGSKIKAYDGLFIVNDLDDKTIRWVLDMKIDPEEIPKKKEVRLKVCKNNQEVV